MLFSLSLMKREKGQNGPLLHVKTSVPFNKDSLVEIVTVVLKIFKFRQYVLAILLLFSFGKVRSPSLNKLETPFCQVWLKLAKWFWRGY